MNDKVKFFLKWLAVPAVYSLIAVFVSLYWLKYGIFSIFLFLIYAAEFVFTAAKTLGWIFLPAWLTLTLSLAYVKNKNVPRIAAFAFPVFSAAFTVFCFYSDIKLLVNEKLSVFILIMPLAMYFLLLPAFIADSAVVKMRQSSYLYPEENNERKAYPILRTGVTLCISLLTGGIVFGALTAKQAADEKAEQQLIIKTQQQLEYADSRILTEYGSDMLLIADYAVKHRIYDWSECPDEDLEQPWINVFETAGADTEITRNSGGVNFRYGDAVHCVAVAEDLADISERN